MSGTHVDQWEWNTQPAANQSWSIQARQALKLFGPALMLVIVYLVGYHLPHRQKALELLREQRRFQGRGSADRMAALTNERAELLKKTRAQEQHSERSEKLVSVKKDLAARVSVADVPTFVEGVANRRMDRLLRVLRNHDVNCVGVRAIEEEAPDVLEFERLMQHIDRLLPAGRTDGASGRSSNGKDVDPKSLGGALTKYELSLRCSFSEMVAACHQIAQLGPRVSVLSLVMEKASSDESTRTWTLRVAL